MNKTLIALLVTLLCLLSGQIGTEEGVEPHGGAGGCRALPSECHSGPQARHLASSPRESKAEAARTKGQMKANGELGDFSLSPSSSGDWGLRSLAEDCKSRPGAQLSADSYLPFLFSWHPQTLSSSPHHLPPRVL